MGNRDLAWLILIGVAIILILQVLAHHGPTPEETILQIRCAEKARAEAEGNDKFLVHIKCDEEDSPDVGQKEE